ncbi:MAG: type II secretion system F family protein [Desulfobacterales bacterium]|nr:type II secretion system F family protein [Desulfobacterales bacterium]
MNYYRYKLIAPTGKIQAGVTRLPYQDIMSAISYLERDGSVTIYVKKLGRLLAFIFLLSSFSLRKKMSRTDQAEFLNNISVMLRAGVPLITALEESAGVSDAAEVATDMNDIVSSIQGGATFSEVAQRYRYIFPKTVIHLIQIGEETGRLDAMLKDASEHLKRIQNIVSDTKQALLYPSFVLAAMGSGLLFWLYYVVPQILVLFKEMDVTLPPITVFVMTVSNFVQDYFFHILGGTALTVVAVGVARRSSLKIKKAISAMLLKLPIVGTIIQASTLAFIAEYFSIMINAGMDMLRSVAILKESITNEVYREKLGEVLDSLSTGTGISDSFTNAGIFPSFVTRMIGIGETSGTLTDQLFYIAEEYRKRLSILVSTISKSLEPIVLVVAGVMFAVIIGALLLPIYDLVGQVSGR